MCIDGNCVPSEAETTKMANLKTSRELRCRSVVAARGSHKAHATRCSCSSSEPGPKPPSQRSWSEVCDLQQHHSRPYHSKESTSIKVSSVHTTDKQRSSFAKTDSPWTCRSIRISLFHQVDVSCSSTPSSLWRLVQLQRTIWQLKAYSPQYWSRRMPFRSSFTTSLVGCSQLRIAT